MQAPFEVLFEADLPSYALPQELGRLYGRLGFAERVVYSNFVSSLDGVVPLGSGVSRATPGHLWTPAHVFPDLAVEFAALRKTLDLSAEPRLVLLTATGDLDFKHPALVNGAIVLTTKAVARQIARRLPPACEVIALGAGKTLDIKRAFNELPKMGFEVVLTEGGPSLLGELVKAGLVDEMFLTLSPVLAGRNKERRLGMVEGVELLPKIAVWSRLLSARRHGEFLFLRYGLPR